MQKMEKGKASYAKDLQSQIQTHGEKKITEKEMEWRKNGRRLADEN